MASVTADPSVGHLQIKYNEISYDTTFENYTMLTGNVVSLGMGGLIALVASLIWPEDYDFISMKQIKMLDDDVGGSKGFTTVSAPNLSPLAPLGPTQSSQAQCMF